jgi:hypothetical protein
LVRGGLFGVNQRVQYLNLNKYAKKDLFKSNNLYNLDIIATRIYILLNFTDYARFYQYPYMWSMVSISIIGSFFYFQNGWMFNTLTILLFIFFFVLCPPLSRPN